MVARINLQEYQMCIHLLHRYNRDLEEVTVSITVVYRRYRNYKGDGYYKGLRGIKIPRSELPIHVLTFFNEEQERIYWDYVEKLKY